MKKSLALLVFCLVGFAAFAKKTELPGIWNAGVGGQLYPIFPVDSIHWGKIRIQKQLILVNLYAGFSVVKGEYSFSNTTDQPILMHIGYPAGGRYPQRIAEHVFFQDVFNFRALSNGQPVNAYRLSDSGKINPVRITGQGAPDSTATEITDWHVWKQSFPAGTVTTVTVYYITQNNLARFIKDDESRDENAFGFCLESGNAWGGKISAGQILVKLNDKLSLNNIQGLLPDNEIMGDMQHLQYSFANLEPDPNSHLLIWYDGAPPDYKFEKKVLPSTDTLYRMMDAFPLSEFNDPAFKALSRKNFSLAASGLTLSGILYFLMFFMPWILLAVVIFFLLKGKGKKKIESGTSIPHAAGRK